MSRTNQYPRFRVCGFCTLYAFGMQPLVAVGDSITHAFGWPVGGIACRSWADWIGWSLDIPVLNVAVPGVTAEDVLRDQIPRVPEASIAATMLGANDITGGVVHRSFQTAPERLVAALTGRAARVLVATIPIGLRGQRNVHLVREANEITRAAAEAHGACLVEIEGAFLDDPRLLGHDRVHINAAGQLRIAGIALAALGCNGRGLPSARLGRAQKVLDPALAPRRFFEQREHSKGWVD